MINEKTDLYSYFGIERKNANGGYLTAYARETVDWLLPKLRPAMLVIPGGGYSHLSVREGEIVALAYFNEGYSSFALSYSINTPYPAPLLEACMAVIYIREQAAKYHADPEHVAAVGFSAGGHLAGMLANIPDEKEIVEALGKRAAHAKLNAVLLSYAVSTLGEYTHSDTCRIITGGDEGLRERLSNEKRVTGKSAPAFIWHTYADDVVPVENSFLLASAYRKAGVPFALHVFEHGWHGLSLCNDETLNQTEDDCSLAKVGKWFPLSVDWLNARGFSVKVKR